MRTTVSVAVGVLLAASILVVIAPPSLAAPCGNGTLTFSGGDGTVASPFLIRTEADLQSLNDHYPLNSNVDSVYYGCSYLQVADITMTQPWTHGIGFTTTGPAIWASWHGIYDGGGHSITGLQIDSSGVAGANQAHELGFIGHADTAAAVVRNVNLVNATVTCGSMTEFSALLVGQTVGPVERSSASGDVVCTGATALARMGGLIGYTNGSVANTWVSGSVTIPTVWTFAPNSIGGGIGLVDTNATVQNLLSRVTVVNPGQGIWVGVSIGRQGGTVTASYAQDGLTGGGTPVTGGGVATGIGLRSAAQLQDITTYVGWSITAGIDTAYVWGISPGLNGGFAFLQALPVAPFDPSQVPRPILQQVPARPDGTCDGIDDAAFTYGTTVTGGWNPSWAQWVHGGEGGPVCGRTLVYGPNGWVVAT